AEAVIRKLLHLPFQPLFILKKLPHLLRLSWRPHCLCDCLGPQDTAHHGLQQRDSSAQSFCLRGAGTAGFHWAVHSEGVLAAAVAVIGPLERGSVMTLDIHNQPEHAHGKPHPHD
ncbi:hypothetical protein AMELA_G00059030, partial [Ameiurus melas]